MATNSLNAVRRIRKVSTGQVAALLPPEEGKYRGFGSIPGETLDQFHDRMFEIPVLEAMAYEMEVALLQPCEA